MKRYPSVKVNWYCTCTCIGSKLVCRRCGSNLYGFDSIFIIIPFCVPISSLSSSYMNITVGSVIVKRSFAYIVIRNKGFICIVSE